MRMLLAFVIALSVVSAIVGDAAAGQATNPASLVSRREQLAPPVNVADLFAQTGAQTGGLDAVWSPNGGLIVADNRSGRFNIWGEARGRMPAKQLSPSDDRQGGLVVSPDGKWLVYQSDRGGNEVWDLFSIPVGGGAPVNLTTSPETAEFNAHFSPDGRQLSFEIKPRTSSASDIAVMDLESHAVRVLTHEAAPDRLWRLVGWSSDGRQLVANRINVLRTESQVWSLDARTGRATAMTAGGVGKKDEARDLSSDGRWVSISSDRLDGVTRAALLSLRDGRLRWLTRDGWESRAGSFSPDAKHLAITRNVDGQVSTAIYDIAIGKTRAVAMKPGVTTEVKGTGSSWSPDSRRLALVHETSTEPPRFFAYDLRTHQVAAVRTSTDQTRRFYPPSQLVHYPSSDGLLVSAFVWLPPNLSRNSHAPGIVVPHGGPTYQTLDWFNRQALALASRGYVVIAPNVRGSTGYGPKFQLANVGDLGGKDLEDVVSAAKFLTETGYVDPARIGIAGASYGGFMTLMAIGKYPRVFAAGVSSYGIIDWKAIVDKADPLNRQYLIALMGGPAADDARYVAASPLTYINHATAPLLVLQGENDVRVPRAQADKVVAAMQANHQIVAAHYYLDEGHVFQKRENLIDELNRTIDWFGRYLKTEPGELRQKAVSD